MSASKRTSEFQADVPSVVRRPSTQRIRFENKRYQSASQRAQTMQCHKSVMVFGSNRGQTNQNQSRHGLRKRLTRHNIIRSFQNGAKVQKGKLNYESAALTAELRDRRTRIIVQ